ncbi:MAG TPA: PaaI family thioesterase [Mycobacteriales bacterium]|jgi:acyl-coenzyme A thioesterase PaaI-like protein|nr:PaaI family thioesterase [Mycobacteriales bacterium]
MSDPGLDDSRAASQRLADAMRRIIARLVVVRPPAEQLDRAADAANQFADTLEHLPERSKSWEISEAGLQPRDFVNHSPLSGLANPIAPPVKMTIIDDGDGDYHMEGTVNFGPAYEGPPGHCHGGFVAAMFDELLGFVQLAPGFTAFLHVDYRRPTPLNRELQLRGWIESVEGRKRTIRGTCHFDGVLLSEAHGLFIAPREGKDYLGLFGEPTGGLSE